MGGDRQGEVALRPDIRAAEGHQQIDIGGPGADTAYVDQPAADRVVVDSAEATQVERPIHQLSGDAQTIARFLPRDTSRPDLGCGEPCEPLRRDLTPRATQWPERRPSRCQRDLLFENDLDQRREAGAPCPQWRWTTPRDDRRQIGVGRAQCIDSVEQARSGQPLSHDSMQVHAIRESPPARDRFCIAAAFGRGPLSADE